MRNINKCPRCGSKDLEPLEVIKKSTTTYRCMSCRRRIGSAPIISDKSGIEHCYQDMVSYVCYETHDFFNGHEHVVLRKTDDGLYLDVQPNWYRMTKPGELFPEGVHRELTEKEWNRVLDRLYNKMYLHEWKHDYYDLMNPVCDGVSWCLTIRLCDGRKRVYEGDQSLLPPYWTELENTCKPFMDEAVGEV